MPNPDMDQRNKRRTSKTSVACQACKRRKTKCSGGPSPCQACIKLSSKCIIDPGTDMRRRDSKDTLRPNKALLDALVRSVQDGDKSLTDSLYRAIQAIDTSGKLSIIAQSYLQEPFHSLDDARDSKDGLDSISSSAGIAHLISDDGRERETWSNSGDGSQTMLDAHASVSSTSQDSEPTLICEMCANEMGIDSPVHEGGSVSASRQSLVRIPSRIGSADLAYGCKFLKSFEELAAFWGNLKSNAPQTLLVGRGLAQHGFDPWNNGSLDTASSAIISFRDLARRNLHNGADIVTILGTSRPNLDAFFRTDADSQPDSAWSWSCRFVRTFPNLPLSLQLSKIYLLALQMRFLIYPNPDTFNDLPWWLRPLEDQYSKPHAASVDICQFPSLKQYLISQATRMASFVLPREDCNWPYSDTAIFNHEGGPYPPKTLSLAFIEHVREPTNHTVDESVLKLISPKAANSQGATVSRRMSVT